MADTLIPSWSKLIFWIGDPAGCVSSKIHQAHPMKTLGHLDGIGVLEAVSSRCNWGLKPISQTGRVSDPSRV